MNGETLKTVRPVHVARIPSGEQIELPADTPVVVTQALGGSFTLLVPSQAGLYRLSGADAEAIGQPVLAAPTAPACTSSGEANAASAHSIAAATPRLNPVLIARLLNFFFEFHAQKDTQFRI